MIKQHMLKASVRVLRLHQKYHSVSSLSAGGTLKEAHRKKVLLLSGHVSRLALMIIMCFSWAFTTTVKRFLGACIILFFLFVCSMS